MLAVNDIHKGFVDGEQRVQVLVDLSFELHAGGSLAITGPSGSGKSTLLNLLAGMLLPDGGEITLTTADATLNICDANTRVRTRQRRQTIGYVHQFFNLIPTLTVQENVLLPAELNKIDQARARVEQMLLRVELADKADAFPETLSGGQQQRVAVARALITHPILVLADEPTGNLDRENAQRVSEVLFDACKDHNAMLIVATHSEQVALQADRVIELGRGAA